MKDSATRTHRTETQSPDGPPPLRRIILWGSYDLGKPRTRILRDGLKAIGVEVIEIHTDIWSAHEDKSQIGRFGMAMALLRLVLAYPRLILRYLRAPAHDLVLIPYMGQFDVLILWPFARLRRTPVVWDMFLSLYDTVVHDRGLAGKQSLRGRLLWALEWLGCRAAGLVLLDTPAHARHIARLFSLPEGKVESVPVGAEPESFHRLPPPEVREGATRILFYGQLIPLHGLETILAAALSERGRKRQWNLIGTGQHRPLIDAALADGTAPHITWRDWVPYETLTAEIARADICLGIFGGSDKAASVVPNKVYQALYSGRSLITRDSAAMREAFAVPHPGLHLVPPGDPEALLDAVEALEHAGFPVLPPDYLTFARPEDIARALSQKVAPLLEGTPA